jgi:ubiquitin-protein ligase
MVNIEQQYQEAIKKFQNDAYVEIQQSRGDISHLRVIIKGLEDTPYEGGSFIFEIRFIEKKSNTPNILNLYDEDINSEKTIREFKREQQLFGIQLIFKGRLIPDNLKLKNLGFDPKKDVLTVIKTIAGGPRLWSYGDAKCHTRIWHPNIDPNLSSKREHFHLGIDWNPNVTLSKFTLGIKNLIHLDSGMINRNYALNRTAADQYLQREDLFNLKAKEWTQKYAHQRIRPFR